MGVKKGDLIDEWKRHAGSCGLVVKVMAGGTLLRQPGGLSGDLSL